MTFLKIPRLQVILPRVRLTYSSLFEKQHLNDMINTEEKRRYVATFILSKDNEKHVAVIKDMEEKEKQILSEIKLKKSAHPVYRCGDEFLENIDDSDDAGKQRKELYAHRKNSWFIGSSNLRVPQLQLITRVNLDTQKDDNPFYDGCYVNALIDLVPYQFNKKWTGVTKYVMFVQFSKEGERLGGTEIINSSDYFDDKEDEDSDSDFKDEDCF